MSPTVFFTLCALALILLLFALWRSAALKKNYFELRFNQEQNAARTLRDEVEAITQAYVETEKQIAQLNNKITEQSSLIDGLNTGLEEKGRAAQSCYNQGYRNGYNAHQEAIDSLRRELPVVTLLLKAGSRGRAKIHFVDEHEKVIAISPASWKDVEVAQSCARDYARSRFRVAE